MPIVTAAADIPRVERSLASGHTAWRTTFLKKPEDKNQDAPIAFLAEGSRNRVSRAHFHIVDQFQVTYLGDGKIGGHELKFGGVHFARAYTPYGPIRFGAEKGLGFVTLRAHRDPGAQFMPEGRPVLESVPNRTPWQITVQPDFDLALGESGVAVRPIEGLKDERGLAGYSMVMTAGARAQAPDHAGGDGQYILVMKGSIIHQGQEKKDLVVIWIPRDESAYPVEAGSEGCQLLVLNFPVPGGGIPEAARPAAEGREAFKTHQCVLCAFVYDEAAGYPQEGIAPGTRWEDVPEDFKCPDCDGTKADFEEIAF